jgi:hypothetical protein
MPIGQFNPFQKMLEDLLSQSGTGVPTPTMPSISEVAQQGNFGTPTAPPGIGDRVGGFFGNLDNTLNSSRSSGRRAVWQEQGVLMAINPFVASLLSGGSPSVTDFLNPLSGMQGIMPGEQAGIPTGAPSQNPLDSFLSRPGGMFLLNLLAQEGRSLTPGPGPLGAIGRAGVATGQQLNRNRLLEAQIGLTGARTKSEEQTTARGGVGGNVQTSFKGANGNMHIITRDGRTKDLGVPFNENIKFFEQPDKSVIGVDASSGERIGTVISPDEAAAATTRQAQTKAAQTLPTDLAAIDSTINTADATIAKIERVLPLVRDDTVGIESTTLANLPGDIGGGDARKLKQAVKSLQANFGFDTLQKMRAASKSGGALGQVSERELDLLVNALQAIDLAGDPETLRENMGAVVQHYQNYKRELEVMKNALREQAGQADAPEVIDFNDLPRRGE